MDLYNEIRADMENKKTNGKILSLNDAIELHKCNQKVYELTQSEIMAKNEANLVKWLEELKTLKEKEPLTGKWLYQNIDTQPFYGEYICSNCGYTDSNFRYCPNCGAKMIGESLLDNSGVEE